MIVRCSTVASVAVHGSTSKGELQAQLCGVSMHQCRVKVSARAAPSSMSAACPCWRCSIASERCFCVQQCFSCVFLNTAHKGTYFMSIMHLAAADSSTAGAYLICPLHS